jgi:hypothetical protein
MSAMDLQSDANRSLPMPHTIQSRGAWHACVRAGLALVCAVSVAAVALPARAQQRTFKTPEEAVGALVEAVKANDRKAILAVVGGTATEAVGSGDAVADRTAYERFVKRFSEKHSIAPQGDAKAVLTIGNDDWPFAFPLVKTAAGWRFDTAAGRAELQARRVGENELAAMNVLLAIVDAQREYASADRDGSGVRKYAMKFASTPGKKDGLYWTTKPGEPESPLGPLVTRAAGEGYKKGEGPTPYHGYYFRLLKRQGANAKGGAQDYVVKGQPIGGFAAVAYPARYASSGVMTFLVNHDGVVFERDLGPDTAKRAAAITSFDPGQGWTPVKPE